jgi:hypothetical protein
MWELTARGLLTALQVWLGVAGFGLLLFELLVGRGGLGGGLGMVPGGS